VAYYYSGYLDIGGCEAIGGVIRGGIGLPQDYVPGIRSSGSGNVSQPASNGGGGPSLSIYEPTLGSPAYIPWTNSYF